MYFGGQKSVAHPTSIAFNSNRPVYVINLCINAAAYAAIWTGGFYVIGHKILI
jgi:hypothetical protein